MENGKCYIVVTAPWSYRQIVEIAKSISQTHILEVSVSDPLREDRKYLCLKGFSLAHNEIMPI
jgi:hypothetical protein